MTDTELFRQVAALEKLVEEQGRQIATLEDIAAGHIGTLHQLTWKA